MARDVWSFRTNAEMAQYYRDHPDEWALINNNARKAAAQAQVAQQQQQAQYNQQYDTDPFGTYLSANPGAGDAWAYLQALLDDYGIGGLTQFVKDNIIQGRSQNEIVQRLRETDIYKKRFAVIDELKSRGLPAMSEAEVVAYEKTGTQLMRAAGLPQGFWDNPDDFKNLMVNQVSLSELNSRINDGYVAALQAPAEERSQLEQLYGVSLGDLAAYYLDPDRTEAALKQQYAAAQASAQGVRSGYGALNRSEAERVAALGTSGAGMAQGFDTLVKERELFNTLPGEAGQNFGRDQQLNVAFGNDTATQQQIERQAKRRVAQFQASGDYAASKEGYTGLGKAR